MKSVLIAAAAALLLTGTARAEDWPVLKEGLWSVHTHMTGMQGHIVDSTSQLCRNHAYDTHAREVAQTSPGCTIVKQSMEGRKLVTQTRCMIQNSEMVASGVGVFGADGTTFHSESHMSFTPPMHGMAEQSMTIDEAYTGPCPAGIVPGDRITGGVVTHAKGP
jgi:hypothetical protein